MNLTTERKPIPFQFPRFENGEKFFRQFPESRQITICETIEEAANFFTQRYPGCIFTPDEFTSKRGWFVKSGTKYIGLIGVL